MIHPLRRPSLAALFTAATLAATASAQSARPMSQEGVDPTTNLDYYLEYPQLHGLASPEVEEQLNLALELWAVRTVDESKAALQSRAPAGYPHELRGRARAHLVTHELVSFSLTSDLRVAGEGHPRRRRGVAINVDGRTGARYPTHALFRPGGLSALAGRVEAGLRERSFAVSEVQARHLEGAVAIEPRGLVVLLPPGTVVPGAPPVRVRFAEIAHLLDPSGPLGTRAREPLAFDAPLGQSGDQALARDPARRTAVDADTHDPARRVADRDALGADQDGPARQVADPGSPSGVGIADALHGVDQQAEREWTSPPRRYPRGTRADRNKLLLWAVDHASDAEIEALVADPPARDRIYDAVVALFLDDQRSPRAALRSGLIGLGSEEHREAWARALGIPADEWHGPRAATDR